MKTTDEHKAHLRRLITYATDLGEPVAYFFDHLAEDQSFMSRSRCMLLAPEGLLAVAIRRAANSRLGPGTSVDFPTFVRNGTLWHGFCVVAGRCATVLYESDIEKGILTIATGPDTDYVRFSVIRLGVMEQVA